jgi:hypothetical protein
MHLLWDVREVKVTGIKINVSKTYGTVCVEPICRGVQARSPPGGHPTTCPWVAVMSAWTAASPFRGPAPGLILLVSKTPPSGAPYLSQRVSALAWPGLSPPVTLWTSSHSKASFPLRTAKLRHCHLLACALTTGQLGHPCCRQGRASSSGVLTMNFTVTY